MKKRAFLLSLLITCAAYAESGYLWHCTAVNSHEAVWNQYGETHQRARLISQKACETFNDHKPCQIVCFPPRVYWRCMSHDLVPVVKHSKHSKPIKPGTWYWTSFSKQIAINGARDACRHNSEYGGCYVDENACASSDESKGE